MSKYKFEAVLENHLEVTRVFVRDNNGTDLGFLLIVPHSLHLFEVHTQLNKVGFGDGVTKAKEFLEWVFYMIPTMECLITRVPVDNRLARVYTKKAGFKLIGIIPKSYKNKEGLVIDQEEYYITREDVECQQQ